MSNLVANEGGEGGNLKNYIRGSGQYLGLLSSHYFYVFPLFLFQLLIICPNEFCLMKCTTSVYIESFISNHILKQSPKLPHYHEI